MPGSASQIWDVCADLHGEDVAVQVCRRTPGRAIKTRWGSLGSIEHINSKGRPVLASVFDAVFGPKLEKKKGSKGKGPLADETEQNRSNCRQFRLLATKALADSKFIVKVLVSCIALGPLRHFHLWVQNETKEFNKRVDEAADGDKTYLGPTVMSKLVSSQEGTLRGDFSKLLADGSVEWASLWPSVPQEYVSDAGALAITLIVASTCQWDMRIRSRVHDFPA
eukprot:3625670-Pyramimonas_sp.AAC.1